MIRIGYKICEYNYCVYVKSLDDGSFIFMLLSVDDMLIVAKSMSEVNKLKILLSREFNLKDVGVAKKILGIEFQGDIALRRLWLSHSGYVRKVLEGFIMDNEHIDENKTSHYIIQIEILSYLNTRMRKNILEIE